MVFLFEVFQRKTCVPSKTAFLLENLPGIPSLRDFGTGAENSPGIGKILRIPSLRDFGTG